MKLVYPLLAAGAAFAQNEVVPMEGDEMPMPEMSWVDWATEYMPGFKATGKYYKYENTDFQIMIKYNFAKNEFEMETPWFTESWAASHDEEMDMTMFNYEATMGQSMEMSMDFKQGMEQRYKTKTNNKGEKKEKKDGMQWTQVMNMMMEDKNMDNGLWEYSRTINSIMDKKQVDLWIGNEFEESFTAGKANGQHKSVHKPKYDDENMWIGAKTTYKGKMNDGNGTEVNCDYVFNVDVTEYTETEDSCNAVMTYSMQDKNTDMMWAGDHSGQMMNKKSCEFAAKYYMHMMGPHEPKSADEIAEWYMNDYMVPEEEARAMADEIIANTRINPDNGVMEMAQPCLVAHQSSWPNMETGEQESCEMELMFRNLLDMSVTKDGQEMIKVTNDVVDGDFRYTVHCMGEELWTVSPMKWMESMYANAYMMMSEGYMFYKEHEYYFNEMSQEDFDWMDFVQFMGNWDYAAQKVSDMERSMIESEKAKCDTTVKEHHEEVGVWLGAKGEQMILEHYDQEIQFWTFIYENEIDACAYIRQMMCTMMHENMGWEMAQDKEMVVYPEYVYVERTVPEMNVAVQEACHYHYGYMLEMQAEHSSMMIEGFKTCRDQAVDMMSQVVTAVSDRAAAETMIDGEFAKMAEHRAGPWACEFDMYVWREHMSEEMIMAREAECMQYMQLCAEGDENCAM